MLWMRTLVCVATLALRGAACDSSGETRDQPSTTGRREECDSERYDRV
jgi:hypothetical protein